MSLAASTASHEVSHAELVAQIRRGEPRAETALVERCGRAVRIVLRQLLRGRPEAEDLFQETFRRALEKIRAGELRDPESLPRYVVGLARNLAIYHFRRETGRRTDQEGEGFSDMLTAAPDQLGRLLAAEKVTAVRQVLVELGTERDRQVLTRFYLAEEDKSEICVDLGVSSLHFNRVLHRARQRFRELFERRFSGGRADAE